MSRNIVVECVTFAICLVLAAVVFGTICWKVGRAEGTIRELIDTGKPVLSPVGYLVGLIVVEAVVGLVLALVPLTIWADSVKSRERERIRAEIDLTEQIKAVLQKQMDCVNKLDSITNDVMEHMRGKSERASGNRQAGEGV